MMAEIKWSDAQKNAIDARGGSLLVSAAAGSGKTAVLTRRVADVLSDTVNPCSVDGLLVVTFTRTAAAELRLRTAKALRERVKSEPEHAGYLKKQLLLLPTAQICTMDAFCGSLVKDNFSLCGISPDYRLLSAADSELLKAKAISAVMDKLYSNRNAALDSLLQMFAGEKSDDGVEAVILDLYERSRSYRNPGQWLNDLCGDYDPEVKIKNARWYAVLKKKLLSDVGYIASLARDVERICSCDDGLKAKLGAIYMEALAFSESAAELLGRDDWNGFVMLLRSSAVASRGRGSLADLPEKDLHTADAKLSAIGKCREKLVELELPLEDEHTNDMHELQPVCKILVEAVQMFTDELAQLKRRANSYDFSDILHFAINLLIGSDGKRTQLAQSLGDRYNEILIDEYQDTNEAQDSLFEAIAGEDGKIFCVGDVKQSIYGFRLAMPELFMQKKDTYHRYNRENPEYPAQITLGENYRSRRGITEAVNHVFGRLMTRRTGELDYTQDEKLVSAAKYEESSYPETELWYSSAQKKNIEELEENEARCVAEYIEKAVNSGIEVKDGDGVRPARYGDFCILKRTKKRMRVYTEALKEHGIPACAPAETPFFSSREVSFLISLLRVTDNPSSDISLACVLLFPVFGVGAEKLARIRLEAESEPLIKGVERLAQNGDGDCAEFLNRLEAYRRMSHTSSLIQLMYEIIDDTGLYPVVQAMGGGSARRANILRLTELAQEYDSTGDGSLSSFLRYLSRLERDGKGKLDSSETSDESGAVTVMTVHTSKGLEYPFVFLVGCAEAFLAEGGALIVSRKTGIGMKLRDSSRATRYNTAPYVAASASIKNSERSEALRLLYVALTRAREHLIVVLSPKNPSSVCEYAAAASDCKGGVYPEAVENATSFADWIAAAFCNHEDCGVFGDGYIRVPPADAGTRITLRRLDEYTQVESTAEETAEARPSLVDTARIAARLMYCYPYTGLNEVKAKRAASSLGHSDCVQSGKGRSPDFTVAPLTGAGRGTAVHRFLEICDLRAASQNVSAELERLRSTGLLTEQEADAVDIGSINTFFSSEPGRRMLASSCVMREYSFSVLREASLLYPEIGSFAADEQVVLEGVADCVFIEDGKAVIIDYKTDKTTGAAQLTERYRGQLEAYAGAVSECEGIPVSECILFALYTGDWSSVFNG